MIFYLGKQKSKCKFLMQIYVYNKYKKIILKINNFLVQKKIPMKLRNYKFKMIKLSKKNI